MLFILDPEVPFSSVSNVTWRQGRQLLRQYLQEIGYTDNIIDVRTNRVRSLLGLNNNAEQEENVNPNVNGNENNKRASDNQGIEHTFITFIKSNSKYFNVDFVGRRTPAKKTQPGTMAEAMILDTEAAVMANFEFLQHTDGEMSDDDDMSDDLDMVGDGDDSDVKTAKRKPKGLTLNDDDVEAEAEEVLNELNLLTEGEDSNITENRNQNEVKEWSQIGMCIVV